MTVFGKYNGEEITAQFSAQTERTDYGVDRSPSWDEVDYSTVRLEALEILGCDVSMGDLPSHLRAAIMDLADEVEFENED